jgi:hypothetical protein
MINILLQNPNTASDLPQMVASLALAPAYTPWRAHYWRIFAAQSDKTL